MLIGKSTFALAIAALFAIGVFAKIDTGVAQAAPFSNVVDTDQWQPVGDDVIEQSKKKKKKKKRFLGGSFGRSD